MTNDISAITQATNLTATKASSASTSSTEKTTAALGKEDFLRLLVAQLKNQDPLNPDNPTEFTAQLAQFSSLEQLFTLNESMNTLVASNDSANRMSALSAIGKEAAYHSANLNFTGDPVEIGYELDGQASEVTISLQLNGATVKSLHGTELSAGTHFLTWDGLTEDGNPAQPGAYTIVLQAKASADESVAAAPVIKSEVTGVDLDGKNGGTLWTKAGQVSFNSILGIYEPKSKTDSLAEDSAEEESVVEELADTVEKTTEISDDANTVVDQNS
jgi:flagellar basal-body rod modification protein FlgD